MKQFLAAVKSKLQNIKSKFSRPFDFCLFPIRMTLNIFSIKQFDNLKKPAVHDLMSIYCVHGNRQADSLLISN